MKLFAIRIENGETVLVTGTDQADALKNAGLTAEAIEELKKGGIRYDHADWVISGFGPQRYEVLELDHLQIRLELNEQGGLELSDFDLDTNHTLCRLYPVLDREIKKWTLEKVWQNRPQYEEVIQRVVSFERTRLALPDTMMDSACANLADQNETV
jgi:hypothetical protein